MSSHCFSVIFKLLVFTFTHSFWAGVFHSNYLSLPLHMLQVFTPPPPPLPPPPSHHEPLVFSTHSLSLSPRPANCPVFHIPDPQSCQTCQILPFCLLSLAILKAGYQSMLKPLLITVKYLIQTKSLSGSTHLCYYRCQDLMEKFTVAEEISASDSENLNAKKILASGSKEQKGTSHKSCNMKLIYICCPQLHFFFQGGRGGGGLGGGGVISPDPPRKATPLAHPCFLLFCHKIWQVCKFLVFTPYTHHELLVFTPYTLHELLVFPRHFLSLCEQLIFSIFY